RIHEWKAGRLAFVFRNSGERAARVESELAHALDHARSQIARIARAVLADHIRQVERKRVVAPVFIVVEGLVELALVRRQPFVAALAPLYISEIVRRAESAQAEMEERTAVGINEHPRRRSPPLEKGGRGGESVSCRST